MPSIYHDDDHVQAGITRALGEVLRRMREGTDNPKEILRQLQTMTQRPVPFTATMLLGNMESPCPPVAWDTGDTIVVHGHPSGPTDSLLRISPDGQQQVLKTLVRPFLDKLLIFAGGALINDWPEPVLILMNGQNVIPTAVPRTTFQSQGNVLWMNERGWLVMVNGFQPGPEINDRQKWCPMPEGVIIFEDDEDVSPTVWSIKDGWHNTMREKAPFRHNELGMSWVEGNDLRFCNPKHDGYAGPGDLALFGERYWHHPEGLVRLYRRGSGERNVLQLFPVGRPANQQMVLHQDIAQPLVPGDITVSHRGDVLFRDGPNLYWWHYHDLHPSSRTDLLFDDLRQGDRFYHHPLGALLVRRKENYEDLWLLRPKIKK